MPSSLSSIHVEIPFDAEPGDTLMIQLKNGQNLELVVPDGSSPGDVLELQVDEGGTETEKDSEKEYSVIPLPNGKELKLYSKLPYMQDSDSSTAASSSASCYDDKTHSMPWPAGIELAKALSPHIIQSKHYSNVLELGSGLGTVGLAAACCLCEDSKCRIVLTDCAAAMPLLEYNVQQNRGSFSDHVSVETQTREWTTISSTDVQAESDDDPQQFDLILGADLLYNSGMIPALVDTLERHFHPTSVIVLAVRWRKPDVERSFFEQTEKRLGLQWRLYNNDEQSSSLSCQQRLSWKDFGKSGSIAFQHYYTSTLVGVNETPKSLQSIDEQDTASMSDAEHEAWERAHTQIYVGSPKDPEGDSTTCNATTNSRDSKRRKHE